MSIIAGFMVPHPPMIVPAVGRGSEAQVKATTEAYQRVAEQIADLKPDTILISSPHSVMYADYFHISPGTHAEGNFARFGAPEVSFQMEYDTALVNAIEKHAYVQGIDAGKLGEKDAALDHGTMVPLYFITRKYTDFKLVRIGLSGLSLKTHYQLGMVIQAAVEELGRRVVYVASGDLSHKLQSYGPYGFDEYGPVYDERMMDVMGRGAFDELLDFEELLLDRAAECGHRSFVIMAGALDGKRVAVERLSHEDVTGVGYGICTYLVEENVPDAGRYKLKEWEKRNQEKLKKRKEAEDIYVRLARASIEKYIGEGEVLDFASVKEELMKAGGEDEVHKMLSSRAGTFVSLHMGGRLRGCIGTIQATRDSVADEIMENALSAALRDPRFEPVTKAELDSLEYSVDVLGPRERITSKDELDVKRYGVIVTKGMKRGLLLPNLDQIDTVEEQIAIAKQKAGIPAEEEDVQLERFEVVRHY